LESEERAQWDAGQWAQPGRDETAPMFSKGGAVRPAAGVPEPRRCALHAARQRLSARAEAPHTLLNAPLVPSIRAVFCPYTCPRGCSRPTRPTFWARSGMCTLRYRPSIIVHALIPHRAGTTAARGYGSGVDLVGSREVSAHDGTETRVRGAPSRLSFGPRAELGGEPLLHEPGSARRPFSTPGASHQRANQPVLILGYAIVHPLLPSSLPQVVQLSPWTSACVKTEDMEISRVWV
jgi:hypothetical protein